MDSKPYSQTEVLENFQALLDDMDFRREFAILNVGSLHFLLRGRLRKELEALVIALWRLTLERSFPDDWSEILESYIADRRRTEGSEKAGKAFEDRVRSYITLLEEKREQDFTGPASRLVDIAGAASGSKAALQLKMALRIRILYKLIFDRLI